MKAIAYLTEPASYTIDLVKSVHLPNGIDYKFLFNTSYTNQYQKKINDDIYLNKFSIYRRFKILRDDYKNYDVIIFNGYDSFSFILLLIIHIFSNTQKPIAIESDTPLKIPSNFIKRTIKKKYLNFIFKNKYIHGLAGGNFSQKDLFKFYGMNEDRIHFLPMVVDVNKYKFTPERKRYQKFTFMYVGRFISLKQIDTIINEFLINFKGNNMVQLVLVGDGKLYSKIFNKYSVYKNIIFKGKLLKAELKEEFRLAHVLVLASNNENWGLVINEAMSAAIPVISNVGIGANSDMIEGKKTGLIFNSSIKGDLALKMKRIYENETEYDLFSKNAYNLMHNYWNFNLYSKRMNLALNKMVNENSF